MPADPATSARSCVVRVFTLNVHKGFNLFRRRLVLAEMRDAVRQVGADLVFLQEVIGAQRPSLSQAVPLASAGAQYEYLADTIWSAHAYGRNAVSPTGQEHGNALLSKFPIIEHRNVDVTTGQGERRGLLHCVLDVPFLAEPMHAICVHLSLRESQRQRQIDRLRALLEDRVAPSSTLVVAGDFNDWRGRSHRRLVAECALDEVHAAAHGRTARTYPAAHPLLRLDRIYVRCARHHRPMALPRRPWWHLSDHAPLAGEVVP